MFKPIIVQLVECPRDAIQGLHNFIPTQKKADYINKLIESNLFEYIDFGSFVSPKAVPQMKDTAEVLEKIQKVNETKLLVIVANERGAQEAISYPKIDFIGYPFSISESFQKRNANSTIEESYDRVKQIYNLVRSTNKELVVYISMAFGNPYGDDWNEDLVLDWIEKLYSIGINRFSIADTTGEASISETRRLLKKILKKFKKIHLSVHLHSPVEDAMDKINAAYNAGCRRFEGAFLGYGGCPFAQDDLVGNIPTELLLNNFEKGNNIDIGRLKIGFFEMIS